ncbi:MAG: hypothetical protein WBD40_23095 [Tepidisphaeraceae bacterium]
MVSLDLPRTLDYASPATRAKGAMPFRLAAGFFALGGIAFNTGAIWLIVLSCHRASWVYRDLLRDPRAYGREIAPMWIAELRFPVQFWIAHGALTLSLAFGLLLAIHLLAAAVCARRTPDETLRRLNEYRRWKPVGAIATVATGFWASSESHTFWVIATRHHPVGSGPPLVSSAILLLCAMLAFWWARSAVREQGYADR